MFLLSAQNIKKKEGHTMKKDEKEPDYDYLAHSASSTECTGLMPTPAVTPEERESYEAVFPYKPKPAKYLDNQKNQNCP